jgi:hypothetical protein
MSETPKNQTLGSVHHKPTQGPTQPDGPPKSVEYPRALYHKDSTAENLMVKVVANAEEAEALGDDYGPLTVETAPAEKKEPEKKESAPAQKKDPHGD